MGKEYQPQENLVPIDASKLHELSEDDTTEMIGALFQYFESAPSISLFQQVHTLISLISQKDNLFSKKESLSKNENNLQNESIKLEAAIAAIEHDENIAMSEKELNLLKKKLIEVSNKLKAIPKTSEELDKSEAQLLIQINSLQHQLRRDYPDQKDLIDEMIKRIAEPGQLNKEAIRSQMKAQNLPSVLNDIQLAVYYQLLPIAELFFSFEKIGKPEEHAFKLALQNNTLDQAMKFLADSAKHNQSSEYVLHDACLFSLPRFEHINTEAWLHIGQKMRRDFSHYKEQFLNKLWPQAEEIQKWLDERKKPKGQRLSPEELKVKINELNKIQREYKELDRHHGTLNDRDTKRYDILQAMIYQKQCELSELGAEFSKDIQIELLEAVRKRQFTEAKPEFKIFLKNGLNQSNFNKFLELDRTEAGKHIPEITIAGASIDESLAGYYLMKVNVQDDEQAARAACYGKLTHCCQSMSGEAGEPCTIHGLTSPYGGFYIVCKGDPDNPKPDDELVAQSWTWLGKSGSLVLDSIEIASKKDINTVIKFYRQLGYELVHQNRVPRVLTGATAGLTPYVSFELTKDYQNEYFIDYNGYCDSFTKKTLCEPDCLYYYYNQLKGVNESIEKNIEEQIVQALKPNQRYDTLIEMIHYDYTSELREKRKNELIKTRKSNVPEDQKNSLLNCIIKTAEKYDASHLIAEIQQDLNQIRSADFQTEEAYTALIEKIKTGKLSPNTLLGTYPYMTRPILIAANHSKLDDVKLLLSLGASTRFIDEDFNTPLILAVKNGNKDLARFLMDNGSAISHENRHHMSALVYALKTKQLDIADELIERGAVVDGTWDTDGLTPIMHLAKLGEDARVMKLLNLKVSVDDQDGKNKTPLMHAIEGKNLSIVQMIASRTSKKYLQKIDTDRRNALMLAASQNNIEIFNYLITNHTNVKELDSKSRDILFKACQMPTIEEVFQYLLSQGNTELIRNVQELLFLNNNQFKKIIENSHSLDIKEWIHLFESVDKQTIDKLSLFRGRSLMLEMYDILSNLPNDRTRTNSFAELFSLMQRKGYQITDNNKKKYHVLNKIIHSNNPELLNQFLNDTNLDLNLSDDKLTSPLFEVDIKSDAWKDLFEVLIQHKADINKPTNGKTLLSTVFADKEIEKADFLLKHGATIQQNEFNSIMLKDGKGKTALHYAAYNPEILKAIINSISDKRLLIDALMSKDNEGMSVCHYAVKNHECFQMVIDCFPNEEMLFNALMAKDDKGRSVPHFGFTDYDSLKIIMEQFPDDQWLKFFISPDTNSTNVETLINQLFSVYVFHNDAIDQIARYVLNKLFEMNLLDPINDSALYYAISTDFAQFSRLSWQIQINHYNRYETLNLVATNLYDFSPEELDKVMNMMQQAERNNWTEVQQRVRTIIDKTLGLAGVELSKTDIKHKLPIKKAIERFNPVKISMTERELMFIYEFVSDSFDILASAIPTWDEDEVTWVERTLKEDEEQIRKNLKSIGFNHESIQKITAQFSEGQSQITITLDEQMKQQVLSANSSEPKSTTPGSEPVSIKKQQLPMFFKPAQEIIDNEDKEKIEKGELPGL
ncbi:ankyrin repeat domain-containing protein [Legionella quateirensis]|uniref:Ankyrin repeat protein n=1 Tax=Legionella quateirensis TaxID=45072 RepID=A0A378L453_9GAMM|nr:ankyrin repeat domain-containing protein [Legionella quateirensis]KTD46310.1 Ankyrin repeat protein [Legionella quateirensis]STY18920.1 Ankyrin repeat protein [Legionella quateirensis]